MNTLNKQLFLLLLFMVLLCLPLAADSEIEVDLNRYLEGNRQLFNTFKHSKSNDIHLQLEYPDTWEAKEGRRPHILQNFSVKESDGKLLVATLSITPFPDEFLIFTDDEILYEIFNPDNIENILPVGAELIYAEATKYEGEPGIFFYYMVEKERAGVSFLFLTASHRILYKKATIDFTISYALPMIEPLPNLTQVEAQAFLNLSIQMGNSIIIMDKY